LLLRKAAKSIDILSRDGCTFESKGPGAIRGLTVEDALAFVGRTLNHMIYRDVEYSIVQGVERGKWMWSLSLDTNLKTSGQANNRPAAVVAAERAIDRALDPRKQRLVPPRRLIV
jgi:hypothetical protein